MRASRDGDLFLRRNEHRLQPGQLHRQRRLEIELGDARGDRRIGARGDTESITPHQGAGARERGVPRARTRECVSHHQPHAHAPASFGQPIRGTQRTVSHTSIRLLAHRSAFTRPSCGARNWLHRRMVQIDQDHRIPWILRVAAHPLAFDARLEQNLGELPLAEHGREPRAVGCAPAESPRPLLQRRISA